MNAVERMVEYTSQPTEGSSQTLTQTPPRSWPHAGAITIDNLQVQCNLPCVERNGASVATLPACL